MNYGRRIVNHRPLLWLSAFAVFGVMLGFSIFVSIFLTVAGLLVGIFVLIALLKSKKEMHTRVLVLCCCAIALLCAGGFCLRAYWFLGNESQEELVMVCAEFSQTIDFDEGTLQLNAVVKNLEFAGEKYRGKAILDITVPIDQLQLAKNLSAGDKVFAYARISGTSFLQNGQISYHAQKGIRFLISAPEGSVVYFATGKTPIIAAVRDKLRQNCIRWLGNEQGGVAAGVLIGDVSAITPEVNFFFTNSGIAHILSVSGVHITFASLAIMFILSKTKLKAKSKFVVLSTVLFFYLALCNFVATAARAVLMACCAAFAPVLGERSDSLSNLCFSLCVLLLISPIFLFDAGFQLSFVSTFGIIGLRRGLLFICTHNKVLKKIPRKIADVACLSIAAQSGAFCITAITFERVSAYVIVSNLITAPLMSAAFFILSVACFAALLLPFLGFLISFAYPFLWASTQISKVLTFMPYSTMALLSFGGLSFLGIALMFFSSEFFMPKKAIKKAMGCAFLALMIMLILPYNAYVSHGLKSNSYIPAVSVGGVGAVVVSEQQAFLVGDLRYVNTRAFLKQQRISRVQAVVVTDFSAQGLSSVNQQIRNFAVQKVYLLYDTQAPLDVLLDVIEPHFLTPFEEHDLGGITITLIPHDNTPFKLGAVIIKSPTRSILQLHTSSQAFVEQYLAHMHFDLVQANHLTSTLIAQISSDRFVANYGYDSTSTAKLSL